MLNQSEISYTLDNYDNVSISCLDSDGTENSVPFTLLGYPESNIVVVHTKDKKDLFPTSFFCESEIGFGKESTMIRKQNTNIVSAVIAQNELDSSTTYVFETKQENGKYNWTKLEKKVLMNKNQTITNSLSMCSDDKNNVLICVFGYDMLSDKGSGNLHYFLSEENTWKSIDMTELCGSYMQVGKSTNLTYHNEKYYLFVGDDTTNKVNIYTSENITEWTLNNTYNISEFKNLSVCVNNNNLWLSICTTKKNYLYKNFELNCIYKTQVNDRNIKSPDNFVKSKLQTNTNGTMKLFAECSSNTILTFVYDVEKEWLHYPREIIEEAFELHMNSFIDHYGNYNLITLKKNQRSDYLSVKNIKTDDLDNKNDTQDKTCVNLYYYGDNEQTKTNAKERTETLKYLFNEYFDTLDSNTFSSYRCFFLKTLLNKQGALFDTKNKNAKLYFNSNESDKTLQIEYENINNGGKTNYYEKCMLGYVENKDEHPRTYDNISSENKYICFRHNGENYFPNGELKLVESKDIEMIDLILESKVITITSLNYATIRDLTLSSLIKVHFFTHANDEEDETKYVIWKTLDGKKLEFSLMGIKDLFYNGLEKDIKVKLQVTSILEDFYFTIGSKCINGDIGGSGLNELIQYQMRTEWDENLFERVGFCFMMNCNDI